MTSSVITVKNATTEYSGTYKCTVSNRVGSDQCQLRLDVVPRKYLPRGAIKFAPLSLYSTSPCSPWPIRSTRAY